MTVVKFYLTCLLLCLPTALKMASLCVLCTLSLALFNLAYGNVPVALWESSKSDRINYFPAFHRMKSEEFQQYILKKVHGEQPVPLMVVFSEENLSMEDFSWQDSEGQGYFPQLKYITDNAANDEFLTSVQEPVDAIQNLSQFGYPIQTLDSKDFSEVPDGCGKILIVKLQEAESYEDRPDLLRGHDIKINEIYSQLLSKCSHVIGLLTGIQSSWVEPEEVSRMRRSPAIGNEVAKNVSDLSAVEGDEPYTLYQDNKGLSLLYSSEAPHLVIEGKEVNIANISSYVSGDNSKVTDIKLVVKYGSDFLLTFNFDNKTWFGYWVLKSVTYDDNKKGGTSNNSSIILKTPLDIVAPLKKSYHSGSPVSFFNHSTNSTLTFTDLQVQPFFLRPGSKSFDAAIDAVEFFTPAIWSGIFVTFLLGLIFTWGITMIMDIRTMDQFDDPKGKTITVTATD